MGGDFGPSVVMEGLSAARREYPDAFFIVYGKEAEIAQAMKAHNNLNANVTVVHTDDIVTSDDKPSQALRHGRSSSMGLAVQAVKDGEADVAVSAGNTGALMAIAKFGLRMLPNITRPALISTMPSQNGEVCMLDLGANVECDANNLVQFSVMGAAYMRAVRGMDRPTVGLMNVGVEELKGRVELREAADILLASNLEHLDFKGFVEGNAMGLGDVDVVVTDGFTGNISLKTLEGTAKMMAAFLKESFTSSFMSKLGYLLARTGMTKLSTKMDPNAHNGAVFIGLNGLVVKSHGSANGFGFSSAIRTGYEMAVHNLNDLIAEDLALIKIPEGEDEPQDGA